MARSLALVVCGRCSWVSRHKIQPFGSKAPTQLYASVSLQSSFVCCFFSRKNGVRSTHPYVHQFTIRTGSPRRGLDRPRLRPTVVAYNLVINASPWPLALQVFQVLQDAFCTRGYGGLHPSSDPRVAMVWVLLSFCGVSPRMVD